MTKEHVTGQENKTIQAKSKTTPKVAEKATPDLQHQSMTRGLAAVLQQTMGNQAIGRMVGRNRKPIQAKMTLNAVNDPYEQEADSVAQQVVGQLNTPVQRQDDEDEIMTQRLQRQADEDEIMTKPIQRQEDEDEIMAKRISRSEAAQSPVSSLSRQEEDELMAKSASSSEGGEVTTDVESRIQQAQGGGQPLADGIRQPMEQAFGTDFSNVRIHTNSEADNLNQSIQARAFTTGQDIFFKDGEYSPSNSAGQKLLAHELAHVAQQNPRVSRQAEVSEDQIIELPPVIITGDAHFYSKATKSNRFYSRYPPAPGWPYNDTLDGLWNQEAFEDFADRVREIQEGLGLSEDHVDGILGPKTARLMNYSIESNSTDKQADELSNEDSLELIAQDRVWFVFNRSAFRTEIVEYLWGAKFSPTSDELYSQSNIENNDSDYNFEIGDTHWSIAQTAFLGRDVYAFMKPEVLEKISALNNLDESKDSLEAPDWIPPDVWENFQVLQPSTNPCVKRYPDRSPIGTAIVLIKNDNQIMGGYAEATTDESILFEQMKVQPPSLIERLFGAETPEQARIRWLADANQGFNEYMLEQVNNGVSPYEAFNNYPNAVYTAFLKAYISLIGLAGLR